MLTPGAQDKAHPAAAALSLLQPCHPIRAVLLVFGQAAGNGRGDAPERANDGALDEPAVALCAARFAERADEDGVQVLPPPLADGLLSDLMHA